MSCYLPNIKALSLMVSDKKFFFMFFLISLYKTCDRWGGAILDQGHNLNVLGRGPLGETR